MRVTEILATLEAKRAELGDRLRQREPITVERHADPMDDVWQLSAREFAAGVADADTELLHQVEAAIKRAGTAEWGICTSCGEPISEKRLAAVPWSSLCRPCAELAEQEKAAVTTACGGFAE